MWIFILTTGLQKSNTVFLKKATCITVFTADLGAGYSLNTYQEVAVHVTKVKNSNSLIYLALKALP